MDVVQASFLALVLLAAIALSFLHSPIWLGLPVALILLHLLTH